MEREFPGYHVRCRWRAEFDPEVWGHLAGWAKQFVEHELADAVPETADGFALGTILGSEEDPRVARLTVRHDEGDLSFVLYIDPRPASEPPATIVKLNELIGGRAGLQDYLRQSLGRSVVIADYTIQVVAPRSQYDCHLIPRGLSSREDHFLGDLAGKASREQVGFRFESGSLGLQEVVVVYFHEPDEFLLRIEGRNPLKFGSGRWLPLADELMGLVFDRVLQEVR